MGSEQEAPNPPKKWSINMKSPAGAFCGSAAAVTRRCGRSGVSGQWRERRAAAALAPGLQHASQQACSPAKIALRLIDSTKTSGRREPPPLRRGLVAAPSVPRFRSPTSSLNCICTPDAVQTGAPQPAAPARDSRCTSTAYWLHGSPRVEGTMLCYRRSAERQRAGALRARQTAWVGWRPCRDMSQRAHGPRRRAPRPSNQASPLVLTAMHTSGFPPRSIPACLTSPGQQWMLPHMHMPHAGVLPPSRGWDGSLCWFRAAACPAGCIPGAHMAWTADSFESCTHSSTAGVPTFLA